MAAKFGFEKNGCHSCLAILVMRGAAGIFIVLQKIFCIHILMFIFKV